MLLLSPALGPVRGIQRLPRLPEQHLHRSGLGHRLLPASRHLPAGLSWNIIAQQTDCNARSSRLVAGRVHQGCHSRLLVSRSFMRRSEACGVPPQECMRLNSYYWQCLPSSQIPATVSLALTIVGSTAQNISFPHVGPNPDVTVIIAAPAVRSSHSPQTVANFRIVGSLSVAECMAGSASPAGLDSASAAVTRVVMIRSSDVRKQVEAVGAASGWLSLRHSAICHKTLPILQASPPPPGPSLPPPPLGSPPPPLEQIVVFLPPPPVKGPAPVQTALPPGPQTLPPVGSVGKQLFPCTHLTTAVAALLVTAH